jgi:hypothetical protein
MKRVLLICPDPSPALTAVTGGLPLALATFLGKPLIEHALDGLARNGASHVRILASDRPSDIRAYLMSGTAWGLAIELIPEPSELTPAAAAEKHAAFLPDSTVPLSSLPQAPHLPLLPDPAAWHRARIALLPILAPTQIGTHSPAEGIWLGLKARVDPSARLTPPCWIGPNSIIRARASIGPNAFIESDSLVDSDASVSDSTVDCRTYLGSMIRLAHSIASGASLLNWQNSSLTRLTDAFLLSPLAPPAESASSLPARTLALLALFLSSPILIPAAIAAAISRNPLFLQHAAALPSDPGNPLRSISYLSMPTLGPRFARWPSLWRIVTGHFAWTGNPPLTPPEAANLTGEFESLWLHTPPGLFTAPEAEGCSPPWDDAARAHAALFASSPSTAWRWKLITKGLRRFLS